MAYPKPRLPTLEEFGPPVENSQIEQPITSIRPVDPSLISQNQPSQHGTSTRSHVDASSALATRVIGSFKGEESARISYPNQALNFHAAEIQRRTIDVNEHGNCWQVKRNGIYRIELFSYLVSQEQALTITIRIAHGGFSGEMADFHGQTISIASGPLNYITLAKLTARQPTYITITTDRALELQSGYRLLISRVG